MARWNEDMEAVPEGETVILLTWWYHQPSAPFSATAYKNRQTGKWWWPGSKRCRPALGWRQPLRPHGMDTYS